MSRSNSPSDDSLDLLLDTICNTFGGVLFISMLVVILINMSSENVAFEQVPQPSHQEMMDAQTELIESSTELERLRRAAQQRERINQKFANPDIANQLSELQAVSAINESVTQNRDRVLNNLTNSQETINNTVEKIAQLKTAQAQLTTALTNIEAEVQREIAVRSRTAELPKQRLTTKQQIAFLMKNGKLYSYAKIENGGQLSNNDAEVKTIQEGDKGYIEPISTAGLPVDIHADDLSSIETKLKQFGKDDFFIAIVVWPDSFQQFVRVKEAMIRNEYEYQLVPWTGTEKLYIGTTNERGGVVQ